MGIFDKEDSEMKSKLVLEICSISTTAIGCAHRRISPPSPAESHFIDWYRLLGVDEEATIETIRKRYHKLALQLHPDKNKHRKAEIAFKLISEAYTCLSDTAKRRAFNLERWKKFCIECNRIPYTSCKSPVNSRASKYKAWNPAAWSRSYKILRNLRDIKERFKEEAKVIENCLSAAASRKESLLVNPSSNLFQSRHRTQKETPVFDPSDYLFQGYPHLRNRMFIKPQSFWYFPRENMEKCDEASGMCYDSPIFESRPQRGMFKSKSTCIRS
ncbi:hypothetical protein AB3S75_044076 [Citrus x aurantiifolia]